jgi:hypothetical protein
MSSLEDEIRGALRSEAGRLREVRPLRLTDATVAQVPPTARNGRRARFSWLSAWRGPIVAVAVILIVAVSLIAVKSSGAGHAGPVGSPTATPLPAGVPRYYVKVNPTFGQKLVTWAIIVGDVQAGNTLDVFRLPAGDVLRSMAASGAADDRTFIVSAAVGRMPQETVKGRTIDSARDTAFGALAWYLVRITPGDAHPVRVTTLPVQFPPDGNVSSIALSADGTELAVLSRNGPTDTLRTYSVATGRQQRSWSATLSAPVSGDPNPVTGLSWVGDAEVGFAVIYSPELREEVRTLDTSTAGAGLLASSRAVWSQDVRAPRGFSPGASRACGYLKRTQVHTPNGWLVVCTKGVTLACDTPRLTGNGQAVVCANSSFSAREKRLSAVFLAYPLAGPGKPRVIASVQQPADVSDFDSIAVQWVNAAGTEAIGSWNAVIETYTSNLASSRMFSNMGGVDLLRNGRAMLFTAVTGGAIITAW